MQSSEGKALLSCAIPPVDDGRFPRQYEIYKNSVEALGEP
jgi:hypothetical protein